MTPQRIQLSRDEALALMKQYTDAGSPPVCPRCGGGLPRCTSGVITHQEACTIKRYSPGTCRTCAEELGWAGGLDLWSVGGDA